MPSLQRRLATPCASMSRFTPSGSGATRSTPARAASSISSRGASAATRESIRLHDLCASRGVPVWHGGMLESGIGRAHNLHLSSLPNFSLPGDVAASRRYCEPDLIDPPIEVGSDGTIPVPDGPGIGVHVDEERVERATIRCLEMTP